ncbi:hypothetical protein ACQ9LF_10190 [Anaerohalosphaeraceae bacterium U12dextr]
MNYLPEMDLFEKSPSQRCILDVETTGASSIQNLCGVNGFTSENVRFNPGLGAFEFGTVPAAMWFNQVIPIQRTDNFRIQARIKLNANIVNAPIVTCQDWTPKGRGWNLRVADKLYFNISASGTSRLMTSCPLPSIGTEHLIEVIGTYSTGMTVPVIQILYDGQAQTVSIDDSTLNTVVVYTFACTFIGRLNTATTWTVDERGSLDTVRDIRVERNGMEVLNVPGNDFRPGKVYNRLTGEQSIQSRPVSRDACGWMDFWFGSTFLRYSLPTAFDTRNFTFACWCQFTFNEENKPLILFQIQDAVNGYAGGDVDLHFYHATGFFKMRVRDTVGEDAPYTYDSLLSSAAIRPVFIGCSRTPDGKYLMWVNDRVSKVATQSRAIAPVPNIDKITLFYLDTWGRRKLHNAWMWNYGFTEADFLNLYKMTKGYYGVA